MLNRPYSRKMLFSVLIAVLLVINFCTLVLAYPQTFKLDGGGTLAKDFSAYYIGSWRLLHDPAKVYTRGTVNDGEYQVYPQTQAYKYLPSFLVLLFPLFAPELSRCPHRLRHLPIHASAPDGFSAIQFAR